jgi:mono/diheme cytochrome c family protein
MPASRRRVHHAVAALALAAVAAISASPLRAQEKTPVAAPSTAQIQTDLVKRGQYLSIASDCAACHTIPGSKQLFAGGYAIASPMGKIYSSNITPSKQFGIGNYTEAQFAAAVRDGINAKGEHLYPAMPYPSYAQMTDADISALYAYFMHGVAPVEQPAQATKLAFPFNIRASMIGWNMMFLHSQRFADDTTKDAAWNRGKYLVDTLAHCSECHTPRNSMMALQGGSALYSGSALGSWHAPNITSDKIDGIGGWSDAELSTYLTTGHVDGKAQAAGPMAEAITNSLQYLKPDDVRAIVTYLRTLPPASTPGQTQAAYAHGKASDTDADISGIRPMQVDMADMQGEELYANVCASCHQPTDEGTKDGFYPSLLHNTATGGATPDNLVATILYGVDRHVGDKDVLMPGFGPDSEVQALTDEQIARLSNYVFKQFGNAALSVTAADVATARAGGPTPLIAKAAVPAMWIGALIVLLIVVLLIRFARRRKLAARH